MRAVGVVTGPLLYHFADMPNESSIELGYAELRNIILSLNFEIVVSLFLVTSLPYLTFTVSSAQTTDCLVLRTF